MHARVMARTDQYLTLRGVAGALTAALLDHFACVRKGHDPVWTGAETMCRRCLGVIRR